MNDISVTSEVSKLDKFKEVNEEHLLNKLLILVTFEVLR